MKATEKELSPSQWEHGVPALALLSFLLACSRVSAKKFFWNDELFSYYLLADPSFTHMWQAFGDRINNAPPLYFLLGWLWSTLWGASELSLRVFSSLGLGLACLIAWRTLRRTYSFWNTSIGVLLVFCSSSLLLMQNAEARMYGLFLMVCSLGFQQYDALNRSPLPSRKALLANCLVHACIVHTHLYGIFISGAILAALILRDLLVSEYRLPVYLSVGLSWLSLIFYLPTFLVQADVGTPRSWLPQPTLVDFMYVFTGSNYMPGSALTARTVLRFVLLLLLLALSVVHFFVLVRRYRMSSDTRRATTRQPMQLSCLLLAYSVLMVPVFTWFFSQLAKPIFHDRYQLPIVLSWSIVFTHLFSVMGSFSRYQWMPRLVTNNNFVTTLARVGRPITVGVLLLLPLRFAEKMPTQQLPGGRDTQYGYGTLPIVTESSLDFVQRLHYANHPDRYFFVLDWPVAVDPTSGLFAPQEYKHMLALKRNYPNLMQHNILPTQTFLRRYPRFLLLTYKDYLKRCTLEKTVENFHCPQWLERRILSDPHYRVTRLGNSGDRALLLVVKQPTY